MRKKRNTRVVRTNEAVVYARVSTKDQEREGFSIPAQLRLITGYAESKGLRIVQTFVEAESAGKAGRHAYGKMKDYLQHSRTCKTILAEKVDRLYRNARDVVDLDELGFEIHFVKENLVISENARPSEKLVHRIHVAMSEHFLDNLSEETRKGMLEKVRSGYWPSFAPIGYLNAPGPDGKKIILPDPATAPHVRRMFERYATGEMTLREVTRRAMADGLTFRRSYRKLPSSTVHKLLQNPLYMGEMIWDGVRYTGRHEPLVTRELFERVQDIIHGPKPELPRQTKHDFTYKGLIHCTHCGCIVGGQLHKKRLTYYHCSGYKGDCGEPYAREEKIDEAIRLNLERIAPDEEACEILCEELLAGASRSEEARAKAVDQLEGGIASLRKRQEVLYEDRLDGRIDTKFHDSKAIEIRQKIREFEDQLMPLKNPAGIEKVGEALAILERCRTAAREYPQRSGPEKRKTVENVVLNASWGDGRLDVTFRKPYDLLADTNAVWKEKKAAGATSDRLFIIKWGTRSTWGYSFV